MKSFCRLVGKFSFLGDHAPWPENSRWDNSYFTVSRKCISLLPIFNVSMIILNLSVSFTGNWKKSWFDSTHIFLPNRKNEPLRTLYRNEDCFGKRTYTVCSVLLKFCNFPLHSLNMQFIHFRFAPTQWWTKIRRKFMEKLSEWLLVIKYSRCTVLRASDASYAFLPRKCSIFVILF